MRFYFEWVLGVVFFFVFGGCEVEVIDVLERGFYVVIFWRFLVFFKFENYLLNCGVFRVLVGGFRDFVRDR